jgi:hypothetical protein
MPFGSRPGTRLRDRGGGPARQLDLLYQGTGNALWLYRGPAPAGDHAPSFSKTRIGKPGTSYGG